MLRIVRGTLAELVGPDGLPVDRLSRRLGLLRAAREQEALAALDPAHPEWQGVCSPPGGRAGRSVDRLAEELAAFQAAVGKGGSNNWAVNAAPTRSGDPLLANDPHLAPTLPPHWYLARVATPEWTAAGATFADAPVFPAGHNGFAAWGVTVGCVDNTDLFLEEVGPDGRSVRRAIAGFGARL